MSRKIKTLIAVAFLTIVVWTAIDFEVTDEFEGTVHNITVQAPNPDYKVTVVSPESGRISVVFTGPRGQVSKLKVTPEDLSFRYVLRPSELRPGRMSINIQKGFEHLAVRRVTVKSAEPEHIEVMVDRMVRLKEVTVKVKPVLGAVLAEGKKPRVEPETVEAVVTESDLAKSAGTSHFVTVDVDLGGVELPEGGGPLTRDVALDKYLDGNPAIPAVCLPSSVSVTLVVESHLMTKMLQDIPVGVSGPAEVMNNYEVVFHEPTKATLNLKVVGPRDVVGPLLPREVAIYLEITAEDKPAEDPGLLREPRIVLPPGVKLADPQAPKIAFNLKRRKEPAGPTE